jgi:hypothetical protein
LAFDHVTYTAIAGSLKIPLTAHWLCLNVGGKAGGGGGGSLVPVSQSVQINWRTVTRFSNLNPLGEKADVYNSPPIPPPKCEKLLQCNAKILTNSFVVFRIFFRAASFK